MISCIERMLDGMVRKDASLLRDVLAEDMQLVHMTGHRQTREEFLGELLDGTLNYRSIRIVDAPVSIDGDTAEGELRTETAAAVYGGGYHRWRLGLDIELRLTADGWKVTRSVASTYRGIIMRTIVAYYSLRGETIAPGYRIEVLEKGHTARVAEIVSEAIGADLYEIRTRKEYAKDHMRMIHEAKGEIENNVRPELDGDLPDLSAYDLVFIGYPNWWNTLPTPVSSFLGRYDWAGRAVVPFCTSMESGFGRSLDALSDQAKGASIRRGLHVRSADIGSSKGIICDWAREMSA